MASRSFGSARPVREHLLRSQGYGSELADLRKDVEDAFTSLETEVDKYSKEIKASVRVATTAALAANTRTANVLLANATGALGAIDGVTPIVGDDILVKDEGSAVLHANDGIYTITSVGSGGGTPTKWSMTRRTDANTSALMKSGLLVAVQEGTLNRDEVFELTTNNPIVLNTTPLQFDVFIGSSTVITDVQHGSRSGGALHANVVAGGAAGFMTGSDKTKIDAILSASTPAAVDYSTADAGSATDCSKSDHKHTMTISGTVGAITTATGAQGSGPGVALVDHSHARYLTKTKTIAVGDIKALGGSHTGTISVGTALPATARLAFAEVVVGTGVTDGAGSTCTADVGTTTGGNEDAAIKTLNVAVTGTNSKGGAGKTGVHGQLLPGEQAAIKFAASVNLSTMTAGAMVVTLYYWV